MKFITNLWCFHETKIENMDLKIKNIKKNNKKANKENSSMFKNLVNQIKLVSLEEVSISKKEFIIGTIIAKFVISKIDEIKINPSKRKNIFFWFELNNFRIFSIKIAYLSLILTPRTLSSFFS